MMKINKTQVRLLWFLLVLTSVLLLLWPAWAWAQPAPVPTPAPVLQLTALGNLTDQLMSVLVPVFVALIGSLAGWVLLKVQQKLHIQVSQATHDAWTNVAQAAALRAAEWARQQTKTLEAGKTLPGGAVMDVAVNWALAIADQQGLPELAKDHLIGLIESRLFALRLDTSPKLSEVAPSVEIDLKKLNLPKV